MLRRDDERRPVEVLDDVGDRKSFPRPRDAEQRLMLRAGGNASGQLFNRLRLVASGLVIGNEFKHAQKLERHSSAVNAPQCLH